MLQMRQVLSSCGAELMVDHLPEPAVVSSSLLAFEFNQLIGPLILMAVVSKNHRGGVFAIT